MELNIVIGGHSARKSSLIRAVSGGFGRRLEFDIKLTNMTELTWIITNALQEIPWTMNQFRSELAKHPRVKRVILALRCYNKKYGDANFYIEQFLKLGFNIDGIALLDDSYKLINAFSKQIQIKNSYTTPTNDIASKVRTIWGWI